MQLELIVAAAERSGPAHVQDHHDMLAQFEGLDQHRHLQQFRPLVHGPKASLSTLKVLAEIVFKK
jgi:hypothetical protein